MTEPALHAPSSFDALVERVLTGEVEAWSQFMAHIYPAVLALCRRRRLGSRRWNWEDTYHDVALCTISRLHDQNFAALRGYLTTRAKYPEASFGAWLAAIVNHTYVDYLRAQPDFQRQRHHGGRKLVELKRVELDAEAHPNQRAANIPTRVEIRRILAASLQADFPAEQRRALLLWLQGTSAAEIKEELGLASTKDAHRLLRAARQRLRRAVSKRG